MGVGGGARKLYNRQRRLESLVALSRDMWREKTSTYDTGGPQTH